MAQRKQSGGSSGRVPPRRPRAAPATPSSSPTSGPRDYAGKGAKPSFGGKAPYGKPAGKPSYGKNPGKPAFGKPRSERFGAAGGSPGKPPRDKAAWSKPARGPGRNRDEAPARATSYSPRARPERSASDRPYAGKPAYQTEPRPSRPQVRPAKPSPAAAAPPPAPRPEKAPRLERNQVWIYGLHAVSAALANPLRHPLRLLLTQDIAESLYEMTSQLNELKPEVVTRDAISRMLPAGAVHQGAALLSDTLRPIPLEDVIDQAAAVEKTVIVILDQVTDPQNVGAILRSAAAFGASAVVMPDRHAPPETGALVKAASGAVELVPLVRVINLARAMEDLKAAGFWIAGLDGQATQTLAAADMTGKVALVLGAEGEGLRRLTRDLCDILVRLPISERMESLNVSAAAAVALYELARKG